MVEVNKELLLEIKKYIEFTEETIDGEWGIGRNLQQLIKDNEMPDIYDKIIELLKEVK